MKKSILWGVLIFVLILLILLLERVFLALAFDISIIYFSILYFIPFLIALIFGEIYNKRNPKKNIQLILITILISDILVVIPFSFVGGFKMISDSYHCTGIFCSFSILVPIGFAIILLIFNSLISLLSVFTILNKKWSKYLIFGLIIIIIILSFFVISYIQQCWFIGCQKQSLIKNNPALCDKIMSISGPPFLAPVNLISTIGNCRTDLALKSKNMSICLKPNQPDWQYQSFNYEFCFSEYIKNNNKPDCDGFNPELKNMCYFMFAYYYNDSDLCNNIDYSIKKPELEEEDIVFKGNPFSNKENCTYFVEKSRIFQLWFKGGIVHLDRK